MSDKTTIEVLGPGCPRCKETYRIVSQVVDESGVTAEVMKNESIDRMVALGVMASPAVVVDGEVKIAGRIPTAADVKRLLGIGQ